MTEWSPTWKWFAACHGHNAATVGGEQSQHSCLRPAVKTAPGNLTKSAFADSNILPLPELGEGRGEGESAQADLVLFSSRDFSRKGLDETPEVRAICTTHDALCPQKQQ